MDLCAKSAFDYLNIGGKLSDSFIICSADARPRQCKSPSTALNDPAILSSANIDLDEIEIPQSAKGKLTIRDVDNPETFVAQSNFAGTTGTFNIDSAGAWT